MWMYYILTRQGELLTFWVRYWNVNWENHWLSKLVLCPYCLGGQLTFWAAVGFTLYDWNAFNFVAVPVNIILIYEIVRWHEK